MAKPSLRQLAYETILAGIESGQFLKGSVTSEGELGKMLDMSRTPVRAALQQLELEGYVRIVSKHGVIILDSSSRRIGNLLEVIGSQVLFSYGALWISDREKLFKLAASKKEEFRPLQGKPQEDPKTLTDFELHLLEDLISLSNNDEMSKILRSTVSRLFWNQNDRRWRAPYSGETMESVFKLLHSLEDGIEAFSKALILYLRILKRTWL